MTASLLDQQADELLTLLKIEGIHAVANVPGTRPDPAWPHPESVEQCDQDASNQSRLRLLGRDDLNHERPYQSWPVASAAPLTMFSYFAQAAWACQRMPQSVPAMTFSRPQTLANVMIVSAMTSGGSTTGVV